MQNKRSPAKCHVSKVHLERSDDDKRQAISRFASLTLAQLVSELDHWQDATCTKYVKNDPTMTKDKQSIDLPAFMLAQLVSELACPPKDSRIFPFVLYCRRCPLYSTYLCTVALTVLLCQPLLFLVVRRRQVSPWHDCSSFSIEL